MSVGPGDLGGLQNLLNQLLPSVAGGGEAGSSAAGGGIDPNTLQSLIGGNPAIADLLLQSFNVGPQQASGHQANGGGGGLHGAAASLLATFGARGGGSAAAQALASVAASIGMDQGQLLATAFGAPGGAPGSASIQQQAAEAAAALGNRKESGGADSEMPQAAGGGANAGGAAAAGGSPAHTNNSSSSSPGPSSMDDAAVVNVKIPQLRAAQGQAGAALPQVVYHASGGGLSASAADGADPSAADGGAGGMSKNKIREKNRQAQRRFRERQRTLIKELRVQVELLCKTVKDQQADLDRLQHENRLMKVLLQTFAKSNTGAQ